MGSRVAGLTAIVTGAAQGIGRRIAEELGTEGANVVVADIDESSAADTVEEFESAGITATAVQCDVSSMDDTERLVERTVEEYGSLDILVNNAGISRGERFQDITPEEWQQVIDVNLSGVYNCSVQAAPVMADGGDGRIVNISSIAGQNISYEGPANYTASKWGVIGLTKHMAWDLAEYGIRVNALCPGGTLTPLIEDLTTPEERSETREKIPLGRWAAPEDHANATLFLVSDQSSYITGTTLTVDGGLTLGVRHEV